MIIQGSMTLEQFITKATLLVDEARYPAWHKDRMVHDTLTAGISNDIVHGKIIRKGPNITLAQVLEISGLETATQESLSQMSHAKPTVNYVSYDKKRKSKCNTFTSSQQQAFVNSMDLEHHLQTANQMLMENSNWKVEFVIDAEKVNINLIRNELL